MALEIPSKLSITLPRATDRDLKRLFFAIHRFQDNFFTRRLRLFIAAEANRRLSDEGQEPAMVQLDVRSGNEVAMAIDLAVFLTTKKFNTAQPFVDDLCKHIFATAAAICEIYDRELSGVFRVRANLNEVMLLPSEVAAMLSVSEDSLAAMVKSGSLPKPMRVGKKRYWRESVLNEHLKNLE